MESFLLTVILHSYKFESMFIAVLLYVFATDYSDE